MIKFKTGNDCINWDQLIELYAQVGLVGGLGKKRESTKIQQAFINSSKIVTAWLNDQLVGAGRIITDGICYGFISDVGVLPAFQKRGIGKGIMVELMKEYEHLNLYLTITFGNEEFYKKLGFKRHKTASAKYPYESDYLENW
jgi:ribosomal protein S18 acetylase RimI-like enzyme